MREKGLKDIEIVGIFKRLSKYSIEGNAWISF